MGNNSRLVQNTLNAFKQKLDSNIDKHMIILADKLFNRMIDDLKVWQGFTGNAQRSFTAAVFLDGSCQYFRNGTDIWTSPEIRKKLRPNETVFLSQPYEGRPRKWSGSIEVDDYYGFKSAQEYIMSMPTTQSGWTIIVGVGAEYYQYIPKVVTPFRESIEYFIDQDQLWEKFIIGVKANL